MSDEQKYTIQGLEEYIRQGDITIEEAKELIDSYYKSADGRKLVENYRTEEA